MTLLEFKQFLITRLNAHEDTRGVYNLFVKESNIDTFIYHRQTTGAKPGLYGIIGVHSKHTPEALCYEIRAEPRLIQTIYEDSADWIGDKVPVSKDIYDNNAYICFRYPQTETPPEPVDYAGENSKKRKKALKQSLKTLVG